MGFFEFAGRRLALVKAEHRLVAHVDATWPQLRRNSDLHDWSWCRIFKEFRIHGEVWAVLDGEAPVALWASKRRRPLKLPLGSFWRLDYIEVDPRERGGAMGVAAIVLVAAHASQQGADGIVFGSVAELSRFWKAVGAEQRTENGWRAAHGLLPFVIGPKSMAELVETANENEVEKE